MLSFLKRIPLLLISGLFALLQTQAQNLVINGSFELYQNCPIDGNIEDCNDCFATRGSPDHYGECANVFADAGTYDSDGAPVNTLGYQIPSSGSNYSGLLAYGTFLNSYVPNIREFLTLTLNQELTIGMEYMVSFKASLANDSPNAINNLGIKFTENIPFHLDNPAPLTNSAHVYTEDVITDSVGWTTISGSFIADSAYRYLTIGNHFMDNLCDTVQLFDGFVGAYYFIDEVSVVPSPDFIFVDADTSFCIGSQASFYAYGPFLGWSLPNDPLGIFSTEPELDFTVMGSGTYLANYGDSIVTVNYTALQPPDIDLGEDFTICEGQTFTIDLSAQADSFYWSNDSTIATYIINQPGTIDVVAWNAYCPTYDTLNVFDFPENIVDFPDSLGFCEDADLLLEIPSSAYTTTWQNGSNELTYLVEQTGLYWASVTIEDCISTDTVNVVPFPYPDVSLPSDTSFCDDQIVVLDFSDTPGSYLWQDGSTSPIYSIDTAGEYSFSVNYGECSFADTITVIAFPEDIANFPTQTIYVCQGSDAILSVPENNYTTTWSDGTIGEELVVNSTGWVTVTVSYNECSSTDAIFVNVVSLYNVNLGNDTTLCQGETLLFDLGDTQYSYLWQNGSTDQTYEVTYPQQVTITTTLQNCSTTDTLVVDYYDEQQLSILGPGGVCQLSTIDLHIDGYWTNILWNTGATDSLITIADPGVYSVSANDHCSSQSTERTISLDYCECKVYIQSTINTNHLTLSQYNTTQFDCPVRDFHVKIYDPIGKLVAESNDLNWQWQPSANLAFGTYLFAVSYRYLHSDEWQYEAKKVMVVGD